MNGELANARILPGKRRAFWDRLLLERSHRLFVIIILLQLMQMLRDFWWPETYSVLYATLAVTAVCELALTRRHGVRLAVEAAAAVFFSAVYSPYFQWIGWPGDWASGTEWSLFYRYHVSSLHPFAELAVGSVLLVHLLSWAGANRNIMLGFLMASLGVMATIDSFFPYELWRNIAWIVAAGLGWLVVLHLRELRDNHPSSWEALARKPLVLVLPAVIVIALLMVAGMLMPRAPALLEDPYTIWSEAQGREVPSAGGEGGVLGGLIANDDTMSAQSGYSRDDSIIGGGFNFDYSPVMTVDTNRKSYLRGEAKTLYNGKGWEDSDVPIPLERVAAGQETNFGIPGRAENAETEHVVQTVTMVRQDRIPVLFGAGPISRVVQIESGNQIQLLGNREEWELRFRRPARVQSYTIESEVTVLDPAELRKVANPAPDEASIDLRPYLQLPDSLPGRVRNLAAEVAAGAANNYDKASLLEKYLKETFAYNNQPDLGKQTSPDVVDAFLFEIQEGYCDYFSSAFVVMARSVGLPARWVKGYVSGIDFSRANSFPFGDLEEDPDGPGTYTVRNADAHSWAEVYFEGYGWIPFEPTAGFSVPQPVAETPVPETEPQTPAAPQPPAQAPAAAAAIDWRYPAAGAAILLMAAAAVYLLRKRRGAKLWTRIRHAGSSPNQRIVREMEKLVKFMKKRGLKREAHETVRESFQRWGERYVSFRPDLEKLLSGFERARYGKEAAAESEVREFEAAAAKLRKMLQ